MGALFSNVVRFGRLLHDLGLDVPVGRSLDVAAALEWVDVGRRDDVYHTLRTLLVRRARDLPLFDEAFEVFWRPGDRGRTTLDLQALGERRKFGVPGVVAPAADARSDGSTEGTVNLQQVASASASEREVLRTKDFGALTHDELHAVSRMIRELVWAPGRRVTRRWKAGAGAALDLRRLLRSSLRHGEVPVLPTRRRRQRDRPLVLICDVSGSMERYTRMLLQFVCGVSALARQGRDVRLRHAPVTAHPTAEDPTDRRPPGESGTSGSGPRRRHADGPGAPRLPPSLGQTSPGAKRRRADDFRRLGPGGSGRAP